MESANIVGYYTAGTVEGGQLVSAAFLKPGAAGFWVSDIKLSGYQEDTAFVDNTDYTANFCLLDYAGRTTTAKGSYFFYSDAPDWAGGFEGGVWYDADLTAITAQGENDLLLNPAQAIWLELPGGDGEHPVTFTSAGEVIQSDVSIDLVEGGNTVGNPMAASVWVSGLSLAGYEEDTAFVDNTDYTANFCILDYAGRTTTAKGSYFFYSDAPDWAGGFEGGVWYDADLTAITAQGENDVQLNPGQGLWFETPGGDGEHTVTLTFPAPVL